MQIENATYHRWSEPPAKGGDIPEKGVDLQVIVKNWPANTRPSYIIFDDQKSFKAEISDTTDAGLVISARIISTSSLLDETSGQTELSDRLTYETTEGKTNYIEIEEWNQQK